MHEMSSVERIGNMLRRRPVDRIPVYEHFWGDTQRGWAEDGFIGADEDLTEHFGLDIHESGPFNFVADIEFKPQTLEETSETILQRDGNGAVLRRHKLHDTTPEHVDFLVKDRSGWEEHIRPLIVPDRRRIDFEGYRREKQKAADRGRFFTCSSGIVFEFMQLLCGHENLLVGIALDPDWVRDMVNSYSNLVVGLQEILFAEEGCPDGVWLCEDMGFKGHPFISPTMYREILQPGHSRIFGFAHANDLPVILHSCGMVAPLVPGLLEAGMDCLQAIEVKAGMDLLQLYKDFGEVLSFMGGIDVRAVYTNSREAIDTELEAKVPVVKGNYGYCLHSDHSIPANVHHDTLAYFIRKGLSLGAYQ